MAASVTTKKADILKLAYERFYKTGFTATGVDKVMAESGISKRTLYKYFPSKDDLIEAVLGEYARYVNATLFEPVRSSGLPPQEKILKCFDVRKEMLDTDKRGCLAIRGSQEFVGQNERLTGICRELGSYVERQFIHMCEQAGLAAPEALGKQITVLFQGALLLSQAYGNSEPFRSAKEATQVLLLDHKRKG
ncbi:TetR/AcrR family transcriptional regulator [Rhizobium sp. Rhizsp82]|uniref:TetR/AcrR family transcriptional regulator n=1 Tax=Rhizobium sp. Rhizsp82 TaxID=3243057 RepID=UPI0039B39DA3